MGLLGWLVYECRTQACNSAKVRHTYISHLKLNDGMSVCIWVCRPACIQTRSCQAGVPLNLLASVSKFETDAAGYMLLSVVAANTSTTACLHYLGCVRFGFTASAHLLTRLAWGACFLTRQVSCCFQGAACLYDSFRYCSAAPFIVNMLYISFRPCVTTCIVS